MSQKDDLRKRVVRKRHIKESVQRHNQLSARRAQQASKKEFKEAKNNLKEVRTALKKAEKTKGEFIDGEKIVTDLEKAKAAKKAAKKVKKEVRKTNPTIAQKARQTAKRQALNAAREVRRTALSQDDTLSDLQNAYYRVKDTKTVTTQAAKVSRKGAKVAYRGAKGTVKISRYTYQNIKKSGRTAVKATRATAKTANTLAQTSVKVTKQVASSAATLFSNPVTWIVSGVIAFFLFIVILVSSIFSSNVIQQDEFSLNQSWLHISKMDREKSSDQVEYYTDIDSILLYMNFRYGEWEPDAKWDDGTGGKIAGTLGFNHFSDALDDIWKEENSDINHLKTMSDLYTNGKGWIKLDKEELADYKELLDSQSETGKYLAYQELSNPFDAADDPKSDSDYLTISKRYGYTDKETIDPTTTLQAQSGQKLYAVMDGKATVTTKDLRGQETKTKNLIISDKEARFIYYDIASLRVKTGDTIKSGDELGAVSGGTSKR